MRRLAPILVVLLVAQAFPMPAAAASSGVSRQWGANRYATAANISFNNFSPGVDVVYVANGLNFPDALAAGPAAAALGGPVLLVTPTSIPAETAAELNRLNPDRIIIAGGTAVVSSGVQAALGAYSSNVSRQWGANRYATAANVSLNTFSPGVNVVYVANGLNFPDALAAGPAAGAIGGPVLLVKPTSIPPETAAELNRLNPDRIIIAGGPAVVSSGVQASLGAYSSNVSRQWGANRYATAANVSLNTFSPGVNVVYVASGLNFPDALAAGPAAAHLGGPLLLVSTCSIPAETANELNRLNPEQIIIAGGTAVVCSGLEGQLTQYISCVSAPPDTDGDGINDTTDPFACDPTNATGRSLPFTLSFNGGGGGLEDAGFTGLMTNGSTPSLQLYTPAEVAVNANRFLVPNVPEGDAVGAGNTLRNGFQVNVTTPVSSFTLHARVCDPSSFPSQDSASLGIFFGPGNQDNYIKATLKGTASGHAVHDSREVSGAAVGIATKLEPMIASASCVDLYLFVNSSTLKFSPSFRLLDASGNPTDCSGVDPGVQTRCGFGGNSALRTVPASWINGTGGPLAVGVFTTSIGPAPTFDASYDFLEVVPGAIP